MIPWADEQLATGPEALCLRVLGAPVSVTFGSDVPPERVAELRRAWSRCLDSGTPVDANHAPDVARPSGTGSFEARISTGAASCGVAADSFEELAAELTSAITRAGIGARRGELMMLHASGLSDPGSGQTFALLGASGAGKTTATRALAAHLGYISDETVGVDRSGRVVPFPKPLSVIVDPAPEPKRQVGPDELGLKIAHDAPRLAAIVFLHRDPSAEKAVATPIGFAESVLLLALQTSWLSHADRPLQWLCSVLEACGGSVQATYGEAEELLALLPPLLESPPLATAWVPSEGGRPDGSEAGAPASGRVARARVIDAVEVLEEGGIPEELLVMTGEGLIRLGGIAPAIWRAAERPASIEDIARRIAHGAALTPELVAAVSHAVTEMESRGVLRST